LGCTSSELTSARILPTSISSHSIVRSIPRMEGRSSRKACVARRKALPCLHGPLCSCRSCRAHPSTFVSVPLMEGQVFVPLLALPGSAEVAFGRIKHSRLMEGEVGFWD
jgi:hypothetical protein